MLISVSDLSRYFGVMPRGILHVGAHNAEEAEAYQAAGWGRTIWVDMLPEKVEALRQRFDGDDNNSIIHAACWDEDGQELPIFRASNGESSSVLEPNYHLKAHPHIKFTTLNSMRSSRLDTILPIEAMFDFMNIDVQGAELHVLKGLGTRLNNLRWIYLEVNTAELYTGCSHLADIDVFLRECGFRRMALHILPDVGWGDAFYIRWQGLPISTKVSRRLQSAIWLLSRKLRTLADRIRLLLLRLLSTAKSLAK